MARNQKATTLGVTIPVDMAQAVYQLVREGRYASVSEVVRAAVQRMLDKEGIVLPEPTGDENTTAKKQGGARQRPR